MDSELSQDLILQSLLDSFSEFVINFHLNKLNTTLSKLLHILKASEGHFKDESSIVFIIERGAKKFGKKGLKNKKKKS